jgi:glutathione S-transferase
MVASAPRMTPDLVNPADTPRILAWLDKMNDRPAVQKALAMPNKVPEMLRTFG